MVHDDGTINLRKKDNENEPEFKINPVDNHDEDAFGKLKGVPVSESEDSAMRPYEKVKVKFDKFVNLIATHAYEDIIENHRDDDVVISTDLLTDLANAHEEKEDRKVPLIFVVGVILGVGLTWIILRM